MNRKLNILIISQYYWPESFKISDIAQELVKNGHTVTVYTGLPNYPLGKFFPGYSLFRGPYQQQHNGVRIIRSPLIPRFFASNKGRPIGLIFNYLSFAIFATILSPFLVRGKYDRIFMYEVSPIFSALPAIFIRYLKKIPIIIWITDLWPESLVATGAVTNEKAINWVGQFVKFVYKNSDLIYTSSRGFIPRIEKYGIDSKKIKYWPQWAEALFSQNTSLNYVDNNFPNNAFTVLFAGNIGMAQDMPNIIAAAELLREHAHIQFVILGDGMVKKESEQAIAKKNLKNIHFLGKKPMETMPYYYAKANVLLVSLNDSDLFSVTLPAKLQSYLASSKAVLACLNGEGAELVEKWKAGLTCPAGNPQKLSDTVLKFSKMSQEELEIMGRNAGTCYQQEFSKDKLMKILEKDLNEISYNQNR